MRAVVMLILPALLGLPGCVPAGEVDITVFLKELNQEIAPLAISCPEWHYPPGETVVCTLESTDSTGSVAVGISEIGVEVLDFAGAQERMKPVDAGSQ